MMSLWIGPMRQHIPGFKELSEHENVNTLMPKECAYIPMVCGPSTNLDILVKEGDHVFVGTKLAETNERNHIPIYSSVSGVVKGFEKRMHSSLKQIDHMVIALDEKQESIQSFEPLNYETASKEELVDFMMKAGIIGLGGAGFPAYVKYKFAKDVEKLIINAVECEPYITADYKVMFDYVDDFVTGILAMKKMSEAKEVAIAIKKTHRDIIEFVNKAISGLDGVKVYEVPDVYPMGWERVLVREIMHKEYDRLPGEVGALVNNETTAIAFGRALKYGEAITLKTVTISGNAIAQPQNVYVPVGMPVDEIIAACGGYTCDNVKVIAGGPMMGKTIVNDKFVIDRNMNAITVLETKEYDRVACLRCGKCSDHCPAGLQPVRIAQAYKNKDKEMLKKLCVQDCIECGLCAYICPSKIDVTEEVRRAKRTVQMAK